MPDWLASTLGAIPALLWIIIGVGLPWGLVILPRRDWHDRVMVACLSLAFGPALLTVWMFVLGTLGQDDNPLAGQTLNPMQTLPLHHTGGTDLLRPELILAGTLVLAVVGWLLMWRKRGVPVSAPMTTPPPLARDERLLILMILVATVGRWFITSWLSFGAYDPLWVYGYQGRIYTLLGYIPRDIGYYPQFLPLQYAYAQIVSAGEIADHAARAVLPFLQIGSILASYLLGSRLFSRRIGIITAAMWALYPHFGYWTRVGDLEIPVTFAFTGAAAFFLMAWTNDEGAFFRRRYAIIAGLFLGIAMWIKPTAGAFILGVVLVSAVYFMLIFARITVRGVSIKERFVALVPVIHPRAEAVILTGLACIPLGAAWYLRNALIGLDPIVMPPSIWNTRAMRSGVEFGWPLLALGVMLAYVYAGPVRHRPDLRGGLLGTLLIAAGTLPTILNPERMGPLEWLAVIAGSAILAVTLGRWARLSLSASGRDDAARIGWAALLTLPYFITWFYSYSYHYRLSFAIVPLMILPTALMLGRWFTTERIQSWQIPRRAAYIMLVTALSVPGVAVTIYDEGVGWRWLWTPSAPDDYSRGALLGVVDTLQTYTDEHGTTPVVVAPGLQTLPFFFPMADIYVAETPRRFEQIAEMTGATHFIDGSLARQHYAMTGDEQPYHNQWYASIRRENVARFIAHYEDPIENFVVYEIDLEQRFIEPPVDIALEESVVFGDFTRLVGYSLNKDVFDGGPPVEIMLLWEVLDTPQHDYMLYLHLIEEDVPDEVVANRDGPVNKPWGWEINYYSTLFWEPGEYVIDRRAFYAGNAPAGDEYQMRLGYYDLLTGERAPVTIDGQPAGDGYALPHFFSVQTDPE